VTSPPDEPTRLREVSLKSHAKQEAAECQAPGCEKPARHAGASYCPMHASRLLRRGTLDDPRPSPLDRFFLRVRQEGDCWLWTGQSTHGYGTFSLLNRKFRAHRWIYEQMRADIPPGLHLDHLCRQTLCVNPWHLDPVTNRVNVLRGTSLLAQQAARTACIHGHEFTLENTYVDSRGHRNCRACTRAKQVRNRARRKAASA
jgi:hypothetical protein